MHITASFEQLLQQEIGAPSLVLTTNEVITPLAILRYLPRNRLVLRAKWQDRIVAVKIFFHPFKAYWHWQRENHGLQLLQQAGIETPLLLYQGKNQTKTAYIILTTYIENAGHFDDYLPETTTALPFLKTHIDMMIKLHKKNYVQKDWHINNFLYTNQAIYAIDAGQIKHILWQKETARFSNLALFLSILSDDYQSLYRDLYDYYCDAMALPYNKSYTWVLKQITYHQKQRWHNQQSKLFRTSSQIICKQTFSLRLLRTTTTRTKAWSHLLANPDFVFSDDATYLKKGNSSTVVKTVIDENSDKNTYVIKRYNIKNKWHAFLRFWQPTRAAINWRFSHFLLALGIPTPTPCAMFEYRFGPLRRKSFFISQWQNGEPLDTYLQQATAEQQQLIAKQIIAIFKKLFSAQIIHGDTKASNWLVENEKVYLLDLDGMKQYKNTHLFMRAHQQEWQRFLKNWKQQEIINIFLNLKK